MTIDNNNIIMKTPQSLDDLLDIDEHQISTEDDDDDEDQDENETIDENNDHRKQKKSKKKHGKIE